MGMRKELRKAAAELEADLNKSEAVEDDKLSVIEKSLKDLTAAFDMIKGHKNGEHAQVKDCDENEEQDYKASGKPKKDKKKAGPAAPASDEGDEAEEYNEGEILYHAGAKGGKNKTHGSAEHFDTGSAVKSDQSEEDLQKSIYDQLLENENFQEVVESSEAVEHMTDVFAKSLAGQEARLSRMEEMVNDLCGAVGVMIKSQRSMVKSLSESPASTPMPGVLAREGDRMVHVGNSVASPAEARQWHRATAQKLEKAVQDGKLGSEVLARFDAGGKSALAGVPEDICKSYGIEKN